MFKSTQGKRTLTPEEYLADGVQTINSEIKQVVSEIEYHQAEAQKGIDNFELLEKQKEEFEKQIKKMK
jgi:hypothetical protein